MNSSSMQTNPRVGVSGQANYGMMTNPNVGVSGMMTNKGMLTNNPGLMTNPNVGLSGMMTNNNGMMTNASGMGMSGPGAMQIKNPHQEDVDQDGPPGPDCDECGQPIYGKVTSSNGKNFHGTCFVCTFCSQPLVGNWAIGPDGKMYCETDFLELNAKRCALCNNPIKGKSARTEIGSFHPEHFVCCACGKNLVGERYKCNVPKKNYIANNVLEKRK